MPNIALPGIPASGVLGALTVTGGAAPQNIDLPGIAASGTLGALTLGFVASGPQSIALSGITATGTLGVPTFSFGAPPPSGGGGGVATPGVGPNRLPYPDVVRSSSTGEALDPRGVQANFERLSRTAGASGTSDDVWRQEIDPMLDPSAATTWSTIDVATFAGCPYSGLRSSGGAQNSDISWDLALSAGTWTLDMWHRRFTDRGIYTILVDGVATGVTIDGYAAAADSVHVTSASFTVAVSGKHRVTLRMATKNASSTSFIGSIHRVGLVRA